LVRPRLGSLSLGKNSEDGQVWETAMQSVMQSKMAAEIRMTYKNPLLKYDMPH